MNKINDLISRQAAIDALDEQIALCNKALGSFDISMKDEYAVKVERASLKAYRETLNVLPSAQPVQWIPCSERLPEEDHWLGGSGRQFSDEVMVSVANYDDEDIWIDISQTIDGLWALELPSHCEIIAWIPLPEPYTKRRGK